MSVPKLSEAILLGSMDIPQTTGYRGCAIGAAAHAIGKNHYYTPNCTMGVIDVARMTWPILDTVVLYPSDERSGGTNRLLVIIGYLNGFDNLYWTRERIAAWVATIETQEVPQESTSIHLLEVEEQVKLLDTSLVSSNEVA